jgi:hypothetical protein
MLHRQVDDVTESDTVMRVLERNADVSTRYGGGFVQSIEGLEAEEAIDRSLDWFFYVNGVESTVGAADYSPHGGESIWWDYRDWGAAMRVPAVVGAWPQPLLGGFEGEAHEVGVECVGGGIACAEVGERLEHAGVEVPSRPPSGSIRVLVGPWSRVRTDPAASQIERGPQASGVFADFRPDGAAYRLVGLDEGGEDAVELGPGAGLVAATRRFEDPPVWIVTGGTEAAVRAAAQLLDTASLRDHYAVAVAGKRETALPVR